MKFVKSFKIFESVDEIKSTIEDILRDNILDKDIPLKINFGKHQGEARKQSTLYCTDYEVIKIKIGDDILDYAYIGNYFIINVDDIKEDILTITEYLSSENYEYQTFSYDDKFGDVVENAGDVMKTDGIKTTNLSLFYRKEII